MGKLTYSARKTSGTKAGQTVSKDLKKRQPPGIGAKAAARDPTLDIDVAGKCLTDAGFAEFIDDLLTCIRFRDESHPVGLAKVTEFHLQGNNLTVHSLAKLGEVVALSSGDLRELDLSQNDIRVETAEEKAIWKEFLTAFKNCYVLCKLDLSGNPIGRAGLEILARVYIKSGPDYLEADAEAIVKENHGDVAQLAEDVAAMKVEGKENERAARPKKSPYKGKGAKQNGTSAPTAAPSKSSTIADLKKYACTRGLRSIPYFILSDISLQSSSAVHLSRMLAIQRDTEQLLAFLPPVKASTIPEAAVDNKSLIWQPNDGLAAPAKRLLELTEQIRESKSKTQAESEGDSTDEDTQAQQKLQGRLTRDFTRLTKRIRLEALKQEGLESSDIANIAFKMMVVARNLLLEDKDRPKGNATEDEDAPAEEALEPVAEEQEQEEEAIPESSIAAEKDTQRHRISYITFGSFPVGPFHPAAEAFDEQFPSLKSTYKKEKEKSAKPAATSSAQKPTTDSDSKETSDSAGTGQPSRNSTRLLKTPALKNTRKSEWRFGLSYELWRRIIANAVGADGILDADQQSRIIYYAVDWKAVEYECTIKGAEEHQQIWKFLTTVGCFTYSQFV
ncbi:hypothetical protein BJY04DRAFT_217636 [Aspergillus karnatakaensis]|uniref:uncharacterized protein n=1 Tax=Aspergillus karnatakaensis TaxID=1810916 RepID=UPI003CCC9ABE